MQIWYATILLSFVGALAVWRQDSPSNGHVKVMVPGLRSSHSAPPVGATNAVANLSVLAVENNIEIFSPVVLKMQKVTSMRRKAMMNATFAEILNREQIRVATLSERMNMQLDKNGGNEKDLPLKNFYDTEYVVQISLGAKGKTYNMCPDTGSSNLWVTSTDCKDLACAAHNKEKYTPPKNSYANLDFSIQYGSGACTGKYYKDSITFDGLSRQGLVGAAEQVSGEALMESQFSGIFGLAFRPLLTSSAKTAKEIPNPEWMELLNGGNKPRIMGFYLHKDCSHMTFGGIDNTDYSGELRYIPLSHKTYWQFTVEKIGFDASSSKYQCHKDKASSRSSLVSKKYTTAPVEAIADTGTSLLYIPAEVFSEFANCLGATQANFGYMLPTDIDLSKLPPLDFFVRDEHGKSLNLQVPPERYVIQLENEDSTKVYALGVEQMDIGGAGMPSCIFGDLGMETWYTVFDDHRPISKKNVFGKEIQMTGAVGFAPINSKC